MKKTMDMKKMSLILVGALLFVISINFFIVPAGLYNGGLIGVSQIIRTLLQNYLGIQFSFDIAGLINFAFNVPLFVLAYRSLSKKFFVGTIFSVIVQTIAFSLIPIPTNAILEDPLASCTIGGILSGFGVGMTLLSGSSCGGIDILGMFITLKKKNFSVGKFNIVFNCFVFTFCAILFNLNIAIYSVIYVTIMAIVADKVHLQNIEISLMIFTKNKMVKKHINHDFKRGVTYWHGQGAYTDEDTEVLVTVVSKYEVRRIKEMIRELDPKAFVIESELDSVSGGYEKRLII